MEVGRVITPIRIPRRLGKNSIRDSIRGLGQHVVLSLPINPHRDGRGFVVPQDVKDVAHAGLRHRLGLSYEAEALEKSSDDVVRALLEHVPVP